MLAFPFPYIANTLGWMTTELGRQPWLIYGLFRTAEGHSKVVSAGDTVFTLIGFVGLYLVLGLVFLFLVGREIGRGPSQALSTEADVPDLSVFPAQTTTSVPIGREVAHVLADSQP
jgi:cytochrome d ubiquinol oxidase subunit I